MSKKQLLMILTLFMLYCMNTDVCFVYGEETVNLEYKGNHGVHSGIPFVPMDMPSVYYDDVSQEIIIDGNGYSAYYDVDIISESTLLTVLSTN